tara:strand:- start:151 stop:312 length:162 start_codon:yes stop_codon:yes gene_type:complete
MFKKEAREGLSRSAAKELVETIVRNAISEQARALEEHLTAIHNRLVELERKPR